MNLQPTSNHLLVAKADDLDKDTFEGTSILRPEALKKKHNQGVVKAAGPEVKDERIAPGATILYRKHAEQTLGEWGTDGLFVMRETDVLGVLL